MRKPFLGMLLIAPALAACSSGPEWMSRDAEWFSRSGRLFIRNVSIDAPPLTPDKPITNDDLVSADGSCPGMAPRAGAADANALATGGAATPPPQGTGIVALGHTECDVVRGVGAPDSVNFSNSPGGARVAIVTYNRGSRAGIYTFTGGRLTSIERGADPVSEPKAAKPKAKKKRPSTTT